uniref:23S rRNA (adenine(2058)-N(6))-methyltransferase Erm(55) n=1 Tax=Mycobacteroides chelonae TaxID=1774 RepID=UPI002797E88B|nr:23S rRNA (adenine(2058)-N(6))-methyltransferase Erm(55) [Mycobacteroides chelonae]WHP53456.1 23S ribosomal RNA methyltransferase [Mycobacteroides chelonae]
MPTFHAGRHEFGQNFLTDQKTINQIVELVSKSNGPIIEIGSGAGALTLPMQTLRRPITAIEIDHRQVHALRRRANSRTAVVHDDFLHFQLPCSPYTFVGNLPFHQTTAMLRRILHSGHWTTAILLVQWEVARRRAAVGGATMMTAQSWPWYAFRLVGRVPASAFTPQPGVDAGLMVITRRAVPLVDTAQRKQYRAFVHAVFTSKGRGLRQILLRVAEPSSRGAVTTWIAKQRLSDISLPRDLTPAQWAELFTIASRPTAATTPKRSRNWR